MAANPILLMPVKSICLAASFAADKSGSLPCAASASSHQPEELAAELPDPTCYLRLQRLLAQLPVAMYLLDNGLTRKEYDWFMAG
ncbi:MAG: hypothetical protein EOO63_17095, partial [Hymenobacter sp.]